MTTTEPATYATAAAVGKSGSVSKAKCAQDWRNDGHEHTYVINAYGAGWACEWPYETDARTAGA